MAKAKQVAQKSVQGETAGEPNRLYGVAMLKMALELRKPGSGELEEIITGVLSRMRLDEVEFRRHLARNGGLLRAIAERRA
ncbi:MAG TPA: hypothetical protein VEY30_06410 [Myxococcaceae bacterium]|nr:hypothetical protein [Myxococcaceae bacterium]